MRVLSAGVLAVAAATAMGAIAQEDAAPVAVIRREARERSAAPAYAFQLTDVHGARLTGSTAFRRAAAWAAQTLREIGLDHPLYSRRPYHTNVDLFDYLVEDDLKESAALAAWVLYRAANER